MTAKSSVVKKLYLLELSNSVVQGGTRTLEMVLGCYLVETEDGRHILIDSGYPGDVAPPARQVKTGVERNVLECLAELGLGPDDIDMLICTHFDVDHAGYHDAFTRAELIVQRAHYELAKSGHERFAGARGHWDHPGLRYRLVEGDVEIVPGLMVLETSGHTTGHQSVLVRLAETGSVLLAIDAVMMGMLFTPERRAWPMDEDGEQLQASTRKLLDVVEREGVQLVVFGHDGAQWRTLKRAPEYYS